jgi:hypothetical protein
MGTLHEDVFTFMTISRLILTTVRNTSNKSCRKNQNTRFMFSNFFSENRVVCEIMSKNVVEPERPQTIWRMPVTWWISKATHVQAHAQARTHTPAPTHAHTHTHSPIHARAHTHIQTYARAHAHTHTQKFVISYILLTHNNNGFANAHQCYVI